MVQILQTITFLIQNTLQIDIITIELIKNLDFWTSQAIKPKRLAIGRTSARRRDVVLLSQPALPPL